MIRIRRYDPVTQILMARAVAGWPLYWTCAYYVDGLLIDAGCPHSAVAELCGGSRLRMTPRHWAIV